MGTGRTAWHVGFAALLTERAPPWIEVRSEVVLTLEPQRADLLLLRRALAESAGGGPRVLRRLWDLFRTDALLEFKSVSRPCRRGDVVRLLGYGAQYHAENLGRVVTPADLALVLVVADVNAALRDELGTMSWTLDDLGGGYMAVLGCPYPAYVVAVDMVARAERDDLLGSFGHDRLAKSETRSWWQEHVMQTEKQSIKDLEGFDEMLRKFLDSLTPAERLAGLAPQERLAGLSAEETTLALPDAILGALSDTFVATLPEPVQRRIRERLGR